MLRVYQAKRRISAALAVAESEESHNSASAVYANKVGLHTNYFGELAF